MAPVIGAVYAHHHHHHHQVMVLMVIVASCIASNLGDGTHYKALLEASAAVVGKDSKSCSRPVPPYLSVLLKPMMSSGLDFLLSLKDQILCCFVKQMMYLSIPVQWWEKKP